MASFTKQATKRAPDTSRVGCEFDRCTREGAGGKGRADEGRRMIVTFTNKLRENGVVKAHGKHRAADAARGASADKVTALKMELSSAARSWSDGSALIICITHGQFGSINENFPRDHPTRTSAPSMPCSTKMGVKTLKVLMRVQHRIVAFQKTAFDGADLKALEDLTARA